MSQAVDSIQTPNAPAPATPPAAQASIFERRTVLQAAVDLATPAAIVAYLSDCMRLRRGCMVVGMSAPYAMAMRDDAALRDAFMKADLLIPDGKGFVWGARYLGAPCGDRIAIPDLCERMLERCNESSLKVFIYGATDEINAAACANVRSRFPKIAAVAGQNGYGQGPAEEDALIARLKNEQFHLLIVARPSPDKELFLARCCKEAGVVGLAAGGYADILAGQTRRAPEFVQNIGMEWMWRVGQEPLRLWKRVGWANVRFAAAVIWQRLRMDPGRPWWGSRTIQFTLILAATSAYLGAINAPYHFDDPEYIQHNPTIRSFKALSGITVLAHRKLWWLSNAICYKLSEWYGNHQVDNPDVRVFRLWNIACHFIAALALMGLVRRCLRAAGYLPYGPPGRGTPYDMAAFAAGAIFAAHPLCTESVTYICGRDNGQGGMFYLLGLYAAAVCFDRLSRDERGVWPSWLWPMVFTFVLGGCAVLTKEIYLTFMVSPLVVGMVVFVYLFFYRKSVQRTISVGLLLGLLLSMVILAWGAAGRHEGYLGPAFQAIVFAVAAGGLLGGWPSAPALLRQRLHVGWALLLCIVGLGAASLVAFPYAYQRTLGALAGQENSNYVRSLCTQAYAVPWMLLRTIVPYGLNIDHEFPSISDPHDPRVATGAAIILGLTLFGLIGIFRGWLGSFGVLLALISIAPSNTVIERGDIVSERNFYLAAAGGACFIAWVMVVLTGGLKALVYPTFRTLDEAEWTRRLPALREAGLWTGTLACCLAGPFTSYTILRNQEWMEPLRLWESSVKEGSRNKIRVLYNLGVTYASLHRYDDAENQFSNVISIGNEKVDKNLFRSDEAVEIKCYHLAYLDLARMQLMRYMKSGRQDFAPLNRIDELLKKGLERTTYDPDLTVGYAQFQNEQGHFNQALPYLKRSLELHTSAEQLHYPLGVAQLENGDSLAAMQSLSMASNIRDIHSLGVELDMPAENASDVYAFLGLSKFLLKDYHGAAADFVRSLTFDPHGVTQLIMYSLRTRNPNLHPVDINPPDAFQEALTRMRRDLLRQLRDCAERALQNDKLVRSRTLVESLHGAFDMELKRREKVQARREKAGFTDDPDEITEPPK